MKISIAIPARYASTRFPGKPLAKIAGETMLARVVKLAQVAAQGFGDINVFVATEDARIAAHAAEIGAACIMTPDTCPTGSDRVLAAIEQLEHRPDFVLNLQGDAPFIPVPVVRAMIEAFRAKPDLEVITPVHRLSWGDLDRLRVSKKVTPFSGTTAILNKDNEALWFSKNIIPAIRKEDDLRAQSPVSPIYQHMGLYGFRVDVLERFCALPQGAYEKLEGLEQLRMLEHGIKIRAIPVEIAQGEIQSGIDSPEDLARAEKILAGG